MRAQFLTNSLTIAGITACLLLVLPQAASAQNIGSGPVYLGGSAKSTPKTTTVARPAAQPYERSTQSAPANSFAQGMNAVSAERTASNAKFADARRAELAKRIETTNADLKQYWAQKNQAAGQQQQRKQQQGGMATGAGAAATGVVSTDTAPVTMRYQGRTQDAAPTRVFNVD